MSTVVTCGNCNKFLVFQTGMSQVTIQPSVMIGRFNIFCWKCLNFLFEVRYLMSNFESTSHEINWKFHIFVWRFKWPLLLERGPWAIRLWWHWSPEAGILWECFWYNFNIWDSLIRHQEFFNRTLKLCHFTRFYLWH